MNVGEFTVEELTLGDAARTDVIIEGGEPASSNAHAIYATLELTKIALLLFLGFSSLNDRR